MNSRQLQYAILLSKIRNFSQVAEKLNISQPALSKQILALESELGVKLFDRNASPLALTPAGEHFIREAESLLFKESQLLRSMEQFRSGEAGTLTVGITPFRSTYLIADAISKVRKAYPDIRIRLHEEPSLILKKDVAEGKFDLAIVNLPVDDSVLEVMPLETDRLVLVIPSAMAATLPESSNGTVRFQDCESIPFAVVGAAQEMRQLFEKLCARTKINPPIAVEALNLTTVWSVARAGIAATILPKQFVTQMPQEELTILDIEDAPYIQQPVVAFRHDQVLTDAAKYLISLLTDIDK